ncbi:MAG: hypothetical protein SWK76_01340 [Actinomycetota bacterium]|nr:hypothetical protein [Actinomycetota bacterium]
MEIAESDLRDTLDSVRNCAYKSFFVKKLEHLLEEKGVKVPAGVIAVLDLPFDQFTPECRAVYESHIKGQALFHIFSDMLVEIFESMNADKAGWEATAHFLNDTPMKLCALYALQKIEDLENIPDIVCEAGAQEAPEGSPADRRLYVRRYVDSERKGRRRK